MGHSSSRPGLKRGEQGIEAITLSLSRFSPRLASKWKSWAGGLQPFLA